MKTYLVSTYWRGAMNVDNMRSFTDIFKAWEYWDSLATVGERRFYEVSDNAPPRLLKEKDRTRA